MKPNKNHIIGLLALCAFVILYYGLLFLRGHDLFSRYHSYHVAYASSKHIAVSNPVKLKGHTVGRVTKTEILPEKNYSTLVTIEVDKKLPLTDQSKIWLNTSGMMEGNILELELYPGRPLTKHDIITGLIHPSFITIDDINLNNINAQFKVVMDNLSKASEGMHTMLEDLGKTSHSLALTIHKIKPNIHTITQNIATISTLLADPAKGIHALLPKVDRILTEIESIPFRDVSEHITRTLQYTEVLLKDASNKQGTLGLLINDAALYQNLTHSTACLNALLFDIRKQPHRYLNFSLLKWAPQIKDKPINP